MITLLHCMESSSVDLTNRSQQAHGVRCKLMEDSQEGHSCEIISWMHCEVDERLQNELGLRFHVSLQCVGCELKFFTGFSSYIKCPCIVRLAFLWSESGLSWECSFILLPGSEGKSHHMWQVGIRIEASRLRFLSPHEDALPSTPPICTFTL